MSRALCPAFRGRFLPVFLCICSASLFGPLASNASASAGCTASAGGSAFSYNFSFTNIIVNQAFSAGEQFSITFASYTNTGGVASKTVNVGQGDNSGNANGSPFANFTLSAPGTFGPFTVPAGGITRLSMSIAPGQGTMTASGTITCHLPPTVTGIGPASGAIAGGTSVTITGTNLVGATAVTIGGVAATGVAVVNSTTITATTAAHAAGVVNVAVTTPGGTGTGTGIYTYAAAAPPVVTPPPPEGPPPTVTGIPDQTIPQNGSAMVPFTISGSVIAAALQVTLQSSNTTMLPVSPTTLSVTCANGACSLRIAPADGRVGASIVTVTVTDGTSAETVSFRVIVPVTKPTAPAVVLANVAGTGIMLTWLLPDTGVPAAYAVAWGTSSGASNLPVQLVPGTIGYLDVPSLPNGTYYFRVYAVGAGDISPASGEAAATVTGSAAPGPPMALQTSANSSGIASNWRAPFFGATPTLYEVHVGSELGKSDIASVTTAAASFDTPVNPGTYWVRARAASGGSVGAWTSSVQIPVGVNASCSSAPSAPTLLPVSSASGQVAFMWWPGGGAAADRYQVQLAPSRGQAPVWMVTTAGPGTSAVWTQTGSYAARVVAVNACGTSPRSNEVAFTIQP